MATKAVFKTKDGHIQIDRTYRNLQYVGKLQMAAGNSLRVGLGPPPWFWGVHSPGGVISAPAYNPYWTDAKKANINNFGWYLSAACEFNFFDTVPFVKARPGLNLYNDDGSLFFSSDCKPMRVVGFVQGAFASAEQITAGVVLHSKQYPAGKYTVIVGQMPYRYMATSGLRCYVPKITTTLGGYVSIEMALGGSTASGSYRGNMYTLQYNFLIVDITGYD